MRVVVVGYGQMFAALLSGAIEAGHDVAGALRVDRVKYPDFVLFFKDTLWPSSDYMFLRSYKIYDIKAKSVNSAAFAREFRKLKADAILVGSWGEKFSPETLCLPKLGCINAHPSLLPRHRGPNPYYWVLKNGERQSGVTFHFMDENFDTGPILMQEIIYVTPGMNQSELKAKTCVSAKTMVGELLDSLESGILIPVVQDERLATYEGHPDG
jgi:methionyl-tRNA formyltransferase